MAGHELTVCVLSDRCNPGTLRCDDWWRCVGSALGSETSVNRVQRRPTGIGAGTEYRLVGIGFDQGRPTAANPRDQAHNPKVAGSNPAPATLETAGQSHSPRVALLLFEHYSQNK
jgi:hypothetical protein